MIVYSRLGEVGRHGNQLFQVAFTTYFVKKYTFKYLIPYWKYGRSFNNIFNFGDMEGINFDYIIKEPKSGYHKKYFISQLDKFNKANVNIVGGYFQSIKI